MHGIKGTNPDDSIQEEADEMACDMCDFKTSSPIAFSTHQRRKHNNGVPEHYQCDLCGDFETYIETEWNNHRIQCKIACEECDFKAFSKLALEGHVKRQHSNDTEKHQCDICGFSTVDATYIEKHRLKCQDSIA